MHLNLRVIHIFVFGVFVFVFGVFGVFVFAPVFVFQGGVKRRRSLKSLGISASQFESQPPKNIICKL